MKKRNRQWSKASVSFFAAAFLVPAIIVTLVSMLFAGLIKNYERGNVSKSAEHLVEINHQIKLYAEERIENDWRALRSIAGGIMLNEGYGDENVIEFIKNEQIIWNVSDIILYTENGYSVSANGDVRANDVASDIVYNARRKGEYTSIVHSSITYTVPVESELSVKGSRIVAASIVQDLSSFLDNMGFTSFGGEARMYLTQENGAVISRLTHEDAKSAYNIMALFSDLAMRDLTDDTERSPDEMLVSAEPVTRLISDEYGDKYVISMPIDAHGARMRLFYVVPEDVVNSSMSGFSTYVTIISAAIIVIFSVLSLVTFMMIYKSRKKKFDVALMSRDRMFDQLVQNTQNAFELLSVGRPEPLYVSSNARRLLGDSYLWLDRTDEGFTLKNAGGAETEITKRLNEELAGWDGGREFFSDYIPYMLRDSQRYLSVRIYPAGDKSDEYIVSIMDITRERRREAALKDALTMADSASAAKTRFLANMSHDIRTPMNAIVNMTDFAMESEGDVNAQRECLKTIREASEHLLQLINDVLDMSRIESGQAAIMSAPFDMERCLADVCEMIRPLAEKKRQRFEQDLSGVPRGGLLGDRLKLSQVLINLLNNAVKFTPENGTVTFTASETPSPREDTAALRFVVKDSGIGISGDMLPHIFEPFARGDERRVSGVEGTGLGLSICKSYVSAMGGSIICESREGRGSVFTVEISLARTNAVSHAAARPGGERTASFAGRRALLCEDNEINRAIARKILTKLGFETDVAKNGMDGVNKFLASPEGYYDIVYMDIQMPVMDGYAATKAIRASAHPQAKTLPVVAMTANVFTEDVEMSRAAGMNGHLAKPLSINDIIDTTNKALNMEG